ncbi:hypothetical protein SAMN02745898_101872 [Streptomyces sp. 136MFCol5.1]|jgi:hypothetical protein|nr:hypothetical protein SAMN02745898_101872 [Streptomyces sp. 136MFCol5.1]SFS92003.1 hypothetical protein SAMN04487982_104463 [Streptomyces sp. ok210]
MPALARPADNLGDVTDRLIGYFVGRGDAGPVEGLGRVSKVDLDCG